MHLPGLGRGAGGVRKPAGPRRRCVDRHVSRAADAVCAHHPQAMIKHHPDDALLLTLAAGSLGAGPALLVASHLEVCDDCRERLYDLEALGGVLLEDLPLAELPAGALAATLAAI